MAEIEQDFAAIRDEAWKTDHLNAEDCAKTEKIIDRVNALWDSQRGYFASFVPGTLDRAAVRKVNQLLLLIEQTLSAVFSRASASVENGYTVAGIEALVASRYEVREALVMPIARRMAEADPSGRTGEEIAHLIVRRARFVGGRPVITEELAAELPDPYAVAVAS